MPEEEPGIPMSQGYSSKILASGVNFYGPYHAEAEEKKRLPGVRTKAEKDVTEKRAVKDRHRYLSRSGVRSHAGLNDALVPHSFEKKPGGPGKDLVFLPDKIHMRFQ